MSPFYFFTTEFATGEYIANDKVFFNYSNTASGAILADDFAGLSTFPNRIANHAAAPFAVANVRSKHCLCQTLCSVMDSARSLRSQDGSEQPLIDFGIYTVFTLPRMNTISTLSAQQLRRAADIKDKIESFQNELSRIFGSLAKSATAVAPKKRRKMSAAGRARIAAAQKARWANVKEAKPNIVSAQKPKRQMSAAARAKISAAAKARWAKIKSGTNSPKPVSTIPQLMRRVNRMKKTTDKIERETARKIKEAMAT